MTEFSEQAAQLSKHLKEVEEKAGEYSENVTITQPECMRGEHGNFARKKVKRHGWWKKIDRKVVIVEEAKK